MSHNFYYIPTCYRRPLMDAISRATCDRLIWQYSHLCPHRQPGLARLHGVQEVGGSNPLAPTCDCLCVSPTRISGHSFNPALTNAGLWGMTNKVSHMTYKVSRELLC